MLRTCLVAMLVALAPVACGGADGDSRDASPDVRFCMSPSECPADQTCLQGVCGCQCLWDEDCGDVSAFVCRHCECQSASVGFPDASEASAPEASDVNDVPGDPGVDAPGPRACSKDLDCKDLDLVCLGGHCDKECDEDVDCGDPSRTCYAHRCFAKTADGAPEVVEPAPEVVEKKPYGSPCDAGGQCEGGWCVQNLVLGQKTCTQLCGGAGDSASCPGKDVCVGPVKDQDNIDRWICVANDAGNTNCNACMSGLSLTNPKGNCVCTVQCPDVSKCPLNMGCAPVLVGGVTTPVCVPVGQPCDPGNVNDSPCYGACLPKNAQAWFCTTVCDGSGDCAVGTACHGETIDGVLVQWCIDQ